MRSGRTRSLAAAALFCFAASLLPPGTARAGPAEIDELVRRLGSESFADRQAAYRELQLLGPEALPALARHVEHEDPEIARQVGRLVAELSRRRGDELFDALASRNGDFPESPEFAAIVQRGRDVLPDLFRVLDVEDERYPQYDYWRMRNAYAAIGALVEEGDVDRLLRRLDHPNPQQRYLLAPLLRKFDKALVGERLLAVLRAEETPPLLRAQALGLARDNAFVEPADVLPGIARALLADPAPVVRVAAIEWFLLRRDDAVAPAIRAAVKDEDQEVRVAAIRALRLYRSDETKELLQESLADPDGTVRAAALESLRNMTGPDAAPIYRPFLTDPDPQVRAAAAQTLAQFQDQASLPALVALLAERDEAFLTRALHAVVSALSRMGDAAAVPPLLKLLEDSRQEPRIQTYRYLILSVIVTLGGEEVLEKVRPWIEDPELANRHVVVDALAALDTDAVLPLLVAALSSLAEADRAAAVRGLARRNHRPAASAILAAMEGAEDPWFLAEATKALVAFDHAEAASRIEQILAADPADARRVGLVLAAIRGAVRFRIRAAAPRIAEFLDHPNFRERAIDALGRLGEPSVIPALDAKLESEDRPERKRTLAIALARLGRPEALSEFVVAPRAREDPLQKAEELAVLGRAEEARKLLDEIAADNPGNGIALYNVGCVLAQIGDAEQAIAMIEAALAKRPMSREQLLGDPDLDPLRGEPRFAEVLGKAR